MESLFTSLDAKRAAPRWFKHFRSKQVEPEDLRKLDHLPELTIVQSAAIDSLLTHRRFLRELSDRLAKTPEPSKIVFLFEAKTSGEAKERPAATGKLVELFGQFSRPRDLEVAQGLGSWEGALQEAFAKIVAVKEEAAAAVEEEVDPLGQVRELIASTEDLRSPSGKLSAERIAGAFGLSVAELAAVLGRSRQTVSKTPDADALQPLLRPFERVARLRIALEKGEFRRWLHFENDQLDDRTPIDLIREGGVSIVANLVESMITGSPT